MSQSLVPLFLKIGTCAGLSCVSGLTGDLGVGVLGNILHDLLKEIPGGLRLRTLVEPNYDLQKALARAISRASRDVGLEKMIRESTHSLTDLQAPFHYDVEQFLTDLQRRPEEILRTHASNEVLKAFLEIPGPDTFQPLASLLGEEYLPGLSPAFRDSIVQAIHLRIAACFWDEVKGDDKAWRAYSAEVFAELRGSLSTVTAGQQEILAALSQREINVAAAPAILPDVSAAIDATRVALEADFQAFHHKLDALLQDQREIKADLGDIKGMLSKLLEAKEEQADSFFQQGRSISDIPLGEIEADLARRLSIPVETLRATITAGLKSSDALTRSRAELLAGQRDAAIATAIEAKSHHADAIKQLIAADEIIAQAHYEKADYHLALAARQRIAALISQDAEPLVWAGAQHWVAFILEKLARYAEAMDLLHQVIPIREQLLGPDDPAVGTSLNNLANLLQAQGKQAEAELLYCRAIEIGEAKLGKDHPSVAIRLNNLAELYRGQGKLVEAEPLYRRAIQIGEAKLGKDHPAVAVRLNNLALLLKARGELVEAEALYRRALEIDEAKLGKNHPAVATDLNNLARLLHDQEKLAEAEPLYHRAIEISEAKLGKDHPAVAPWLNNLAELYRDQGKLVEAEHLYRRAIKISEAKLGKDHMDVAIWLSNLAFLLEYLGNLAEAEPLYRRMLRIIFLYRKRNGTSHQLEQTAVENYSLFLEQMGRSPEQIETEIREIEGEVGIVGVSSVW